MCAKIVWVWLCIIGIAQGADNQKRNVVVITPDFITVPNDTGVNSFSLSSVKTISGLGLWSTVKFTQLALYKDAIHKKGEEMAKEAPGVALAIRRLFETVEKDYKFDKFTESELEALMSIAIKPAKKDQAFDLLQKLKETNSYIICVTAHDTEEQIFFEKYLSTKYKTQLSDYINAVITIPGFKYPVKQESPFSYYDNSNKWLVAHSFTSQAYQAAMNAILKDTDNSSIVLECSDTTCLHNPLNLLNINRGIRLRAENVPSLEKMLQDKNILPRSSV